MPQPRFASRALLWIAACLLLAIGCGERDSNQRAASHDDPAERSPRVLLVGIDGAALRVIQPMIAEGRLPALASIAERGIHGSMRSYAPLESPRIWTSIATGKSPDKHGIDTFTRGPEGSSRRLITSHDRMGQALWNMVSGTGRSVAVVNWWVTHPPERINGVMVSDHFLPGVVRGRMKYFGATDEEAAGVVHPEQWTARVQAAVARRQQEEESAGPFADAVLPAWAEPDKLSEWYLDDASVGAIALEVEAALHPDLMMVLFKGVDAASHMLFATLELPRLRAGKVPGAPEELAGAAEALRRYYEHTDRMLGRLLERYGHEDLVVVVSDHGFESRRRFTGLTGQHKGPIAMQAILFARGPGIDPGQEIDQKVDIYQITPTILSWLGMPLAEDMDGAPAYFLRGPEPRRIATYDTTPVERMSAGSVQAEERIMEQLEVLGYFESEEAVPSEDGSTR